MCAIDNVEHCDWFGTRIIKNARKEHRCAECGRAITPGESYAYSTFAADGQLLDNKACEHCHAAREWLNKHCGGWVTEALDEDLAEHFFNGYTADGLGRLIVSIRHQWRWLRKDGMRPVPVIQS